jgi:hypothetical protein
LAEEDTFIGDNAYRERAFDVPAPASEAGEKANGQIEEAFVDDGQQLPLFQPILSAQVVKMPRGRETPAANL